MAVENTRYVVAIVDLYESSAIAFVPGHTPTTIRRRKILVDMKSANSGAEWVRSCLGPLSVVV